MPMHEGSPERASESMAQAGWRRCVLLTSTDTVVSASGTSCARRRRIALFSPPDSSHIPCMAKPPDKSKRSGKTPKSKAHRPDVQPIGPALAELLNPAINRGESGVGSSTGLQPPPDNSWDRRAGGEAAAHRARASTKGTSEDVARRDATVAANAPESSSSPPPSRAAPGGEGPVPAKPLGEA